MSEQIKKLIFTAITETIQSVYRGDKRCELSDHLGNFNMVLDSEQASLLYPMGPGTECKQYRVRFGIDLNGCDSVQVSGNLQDVTSETIYSSVDYTFYFTSNDDYTAVSFYVEDPCQMLIDYVIIEEMDISATVLCDTDSVAGYRYGFNGMEKIDEQYGIEGTAYDFGARLYDSRLGRWMAVDPLAGKYPDLSPYVFVANSPIIFIDSDGEKFRNPYAEKQNEAKIKLSNAQAEYNRLIETGVKKAEARKASGLNSTQSEFNEINTLYQEVDDYFYTLKETNIGEYNYFEYLKDIEGTTIFVEPQLLGINTEGGNTGGFFFFRDKDDPNKVSPRATKNEVGERVISIFLYKTNSQIEAQRRNGTIDQSTANMGIYDGRTYRTFANELGDIKYFFENIKDVNSLKIWEESAAK